MRSLLGLLPPAIESLELMAERSVLCCSLHLLAQLCYVVGL